jgi:hypothetical protein
MSTEQIIAALRTGPGHEVTAGEFMDTITAAADRLTALESALRELVVGGDYISMVKANRQDWRKFDTALDKARALLGDTDGS